MKFFRTKQQKLKLLEDRAFLSLIKCQTKQINDVSMRNYFKVTKIECIVKSIYKSDSHLNVALHSNILIGMDRHCFVTNSALTIMSVLFYQTSCN